MLILPMISFWTFGPVQSSYSRKCCDIVFRSNQIGVSFFYTWMNMVITFSISYIGWHIYIANSHIGSYSRSYWYDGLFDVLVIKPLTTLIFGILPILIFQLIDSNNYKQCCCPCYESRRKYLCVDNMNEIIVVKENQ